MLTADRIPMPQRNFAMSLLNIAQPALASCLPRPSAGQPRRPHGSRSWWSWVVTTEAAGPTRAEGGEDGTQGAVGVGVSDFVQTEQRINPS
jgi:hypothetical protein